MKKDEKIYIRVSEEDKATLRDGAKVKDQSLSKFVLKASLDKAKRLRRDK